jgi:trigger factor
MMQVTETLTDGLKREFKVVVPATDLETRVNARLDDLKSKVRINGFRPGKVPVAHLKRLYGRSAMAEVIDETVRETNAKIVSDRGLKLAMEPKVTLPTEQAEVESMIDGKADLAYTVALEVLPVIELADFGTIKLEKPVAEVEEAEIDAGIARIAEQSRPFSDKGEGGKAEHGDRLTISFTGTIDGQPFEGGQGDDIVVQIGSGGFIPGFEEQLVGMSLGETRSIRATFPQGYANEKLAGKEAQFQVTVKTLTAPGTVTVDEAFSKSLGMESLAKLRDAVKERLQREHASASRNKVKRTLLDALDERHKFEPPPAMVEQEFDNVWNAVQSDLKAQARTFEDEGTTEEKAKAEYQAIAERRVRLGLVLAEIGERNKIQVTEQEVTNAVTEQIRRFPGREQEVWEYYRKNPNAVASLRAPLFEEKVVDFLLELASVTEKPVSREELFKDDEAESAGAAA